MRRLTGESGETRLRYTLQVTMATYQRSQQGMSNDTRTIVTVLLLIFVFPVGLIVMWVWPRWPGWVKLLISVPLISAAVAVSSLLGLGVGLSTPQPVTSMNPIEFLRRMTALDVLLVLLWVAAVVFGWNSGILRQLFLLGSVLAGGIIASALANQASYWTGVVSGAGRERMLPFTYALLIMLVAALIFLLTVRSYPYTRLARFKGPDRVVGALLGFVVGLLAVNLVAGLLLLTTNETWLVLDGARVSIRQRLESTPFLPLIAEMFGPVNAIVRNLLPV